MKKMVQWNKTLEIKIGGAHISPSFRKGNFAVYRKFEGSAKGKCVY